MLPSFLSSIDLVDDPASQYTLGTLEAETLCDLIFKAGDEGGSWTDRPPPLFLSFPCIHSLVVYLSGCNTP